MKRFSAVSIAFGSVLCFTALPLLAQNCAMQCPGACLRNSQSGEDGTIMSSLGNKPPAEVLATNPKLSFKLQALLPPGTNVREAASGFKKLGQFVVAVHVSHDLGIPFDQLKSKLVGDGKVSLSKAIQELSPDANTKAELKKVYKQTDADLSEAKDATAS